MLKRRYKRRYIGIVNQPQAADLDKSDLFSLIQERNSELFGYVFNEVSNLKLVKQDQSGLTIISCRAKSLDQLLVSLTFMDPSLLVVDVSGSINKLKKRWTHELASFRLLKDSGNS
jgi:RNase P/RNase MRP subunit POP5